METTPGQTSEMQGKGKPVVCFLGPVTSYTHQATLKLFPADKFELLPVVTIKDIFDTTQSGQATYGVVPFENSTNGSVVFTLDHFADRDKTYSNLSVCAEIYQDVHHCLVGHLPPTSSIATTLDPLSSLSQGVPLTSLAHIKRIYSHPQAWGQVTLFMARHLRGIETIDVSSTSRAAELAGADPSGTSAAISSAAAASAVAGLHVLAPNIEDRADNTTRFFVLQRTPATSDEELQSPADDNQQAAWKSLVSFTVPHRSPGALADVLECFRAGGLNLTSINSRPSLQLGDRGPASSFQYIFFVEFEGHRRQRAVREALGRIDGVALSWRWLGSWENMRRRG